MDKRNTDDNREPFAQIDKLVHEPARLMIMSYLYVTDSVDAVFLIKQTGLTWGNLSAHLRRLESAGYVEITKEFIGKKPHTMISLAEGGKSAFEAYRANMTQVLKATPAVQPKKAKKPKGQAIPKLKGYKGLGKPSLSFDLA
ncbi:MAG: transcriptional regulator [Chloroflexi bacterium]|jgi:DNA-binding transcriptional ArsR family regulator|nr:transcriptional regulator [Chloroflexota bacterium]MBT7080579.1 transcriptional regulator [Chloroflexota bacterium]MBT7290831.1 transcriptional regulator [Chloroflexota bacterium]